MGRDHLPSVSLEVVHPCTSLYIPFLPPPSGWHWNSFTSALQEELMSRALLSSGCPGPLSLRSVSLQGLTEQPFPHWAAELAGPRTLGQRAQCGNGKGMKLVRVSVRAQQAGCPPLPKLLPWKPSAVLETSKCCSGIGLRLLLSVYSLLHSFLLPNKLRPGLKMPESS